MRYRIVISLRDSASKSQDVFVPTSLFEALPNHKPRPTTRVNATFNPHKKDYRLGAIRLDWIDFIMSTSSAINIGKSKDIVKGPPTAKFYPEDASKTGFTNLPQGVVHVFREFVGEPEPSLLTRASIEPMETGITLGILAVPAWMTPSDLLSFIAPAAEGISHLRLIRDSLPNRSIAVVHFPVASNASEFVEAYNGKPFNSLEPELCNIVHVSSVIIDTEDTASPVISRKSGSLGSVVELPTCPVCLERMDSAVTGLITVPCSHTFHCQCLSKWGDSRCPVCRYSQVLRSSHPSSSSSTRANVPIPFTTPSESSMAVCSSCSSTTNLWICLICGNIGCGRYGRAHAYAHYELTTHLYALELETQRVWDYAGDGYVHRLIRNRADGKLVELPSASSSMGMNSHDGGVGPSPADSLTAEKVEAIGIEYSYLLTSQLDSQRAYYEEQSDDLKRQVGDLKALVGRLSLELEKEKQASIASSKERQKEEDDEHAELVKEKAKLETRSERMAELARKLDKELKEERAVSEGLMRNLSKLRENAEQAEREKEERAKQVKDLEDQLRDVMFFLEARTKIENAEEGAASEALGGSLEVVAPPQSSSTKKKKIKK